MNSSQSVSKLAPALLKAQTQMGGAVKEAKNPYFKSNYADLNSVREAATPALNANGITLLQPMTMRDGKQFVQTLLLHESGEWLSSETEVVVGKQNDPQAAGSGISYARRYGLQSLLSIGAVDDDGEAGMVRAKPAYEAPKAPNGSGGSSSFRKLVAAKSADAPVAKVQESKDEGEWV